MEDNGEDKTRAARSDRANGDRADGNKAVGDRAAVTDRFHLIVALIILAAFLVAVGVSVMFGKHAADGAQSAVGSSGSGIVSFVVVFLSYGVAALLLVVFFSYRILSPFSRLLKEISVIIDGDYSKRLFLRGKDVYLIKHFVTDVNQLLDRLESMHILKSDIIKHIDSEGRQVIDLLDSDQNLSDETKKTILAYHEGMTSIVRKTPEELPQGKTAQP
jgi:hypothetical protein